MKNSKTSCHRNERLDRNLGMEVTILFTDGDVVFGALEYEENRGTYKLNRPWASSDIIFRKSLVRKVVV